VRRLAAEGGSAADLSPALLDEIAAEQLGRPLTVDPGALGAALDPAAIVATRVAVGGAAPEPMDAMLADVAAEADGLAAAARERLDAVDRAERSLVAEARRVVAEAPG
jgi:argininosuccinate lyase